MGKNNHNTAFWNVQASCDVVLASRPHPRHTFRRRALVTAVVMAMAALAAPAYADWTCNGGDCIISGHSNSPIVISGVGRQGTEGSSALFGDADGGDGEHGSSRTIEYRSGATIYRPDTAGTP
ncbi:MAG: hypothetical protein WC284_15680, partial [Candidimonas sp.]